MIINTSRFGEVEVDAGRLITFTRGLLGFPQQRHFALLQPTEDGYFFWLQSIESPDLAFVVTDPSLFVPDYRVSLKAEQMRDMGLESLEEAQVLVIVNKRGTMLTGNLQGPIVIHTGRRTGEQLVVADRRFHTRVPLVDLASSVAASA